MQDFEKLGAFYLGRRYDPSAGGPTGDLLLYDAKDLTTHAVCVGMTGSGKTGLGIALLEEAAIDGIPALVVDPKGDLGNLLLSFPSLAPADFRPWVDPAEAARKGASPDEYAAQIADAWRKGLAEWGQDADRIARFRAAADIAIYTPGNASGRPLTVLRSFAAPPAELLSDTTALRDRILSAVSGLLGLMGIAADPIQSREHILLSSILDKAWREGRSLDLASIIGEIQKPPFEKIGVFDLESFYPAKERMALAMALNNLLASPGFSAWMEGEPLDIQRLLFTPAGKPRISILSIAHLSDPERMFFVTLLLNEILAWMRGQSGTPSLRALLYMDEIFGYFPPTAAPPSKTPMLTLLKQARAYGLGIVLATQNPVDLDYKGLANAGTWFIGRLQTERDKARVIEGLQGAAAATGGALDAGNLDGLLSGLGSRVFLMRNVHEDAPVLFQSRWALSYLRGPLTLPQIQSLAPSSGAPAEPSPAASSATATTAPAAAPAAAKPVLPAEVPEFYLRPAASAAEVLYRPRALGLSRLHFVDAKTRVDEWQTASLIAPLSDDGNDALWVAAATGGDLRDRLDKAPADGARFAPPPAGAARAKNYKDWEKMLESHLYQSFSMELSACPDLKLVSRSGEAEGDFAARVAQAMRERRDEEVEKLRKKYAPRLAMLEDRIRRAGERLDREKSQVGQQTMQTAISVGATVLGALLGRKLVSTSNVGRATTAMRGAGRIGKEKEDVARAAEGVDLARKQLEELQAEFEQESARIQGELDPALARTEKVMLRPRKGDITVNAVALLWVPHRVSPDGTAEPIA